MRTVLVGEDAANESDFKGCWEDVKDHRREEEGDAFRTAVKGASESTCLTAKVELQVKIQKMCVHVSCYSTNGGLRDGRENCIAKFLKESCANSSNSV